MRIGPLFALLVTASLAAPCQQLASEYQQLLHPAWAQEAVLENAGANWDALHFTFSQGTMALAAPVDGKETTAAFIGKGSLDVAAPNAIAKQQMKFLGGQDRIALAFTAAVIRFGDGAAWRKALGEGAHFKPAAGAPELSSIAKDRADAIERDGLNGAARQMLALDSPILANGLPWLRAELKTSDGWVEVEYDPLDAEAVAVRQFRQRAAFGAAYFEDEWAHFPAGPEAGMAPGSGAPLPPPCQLGDYKLDITIPDNLDMAIEAGMRVIANHAGRGLMLALDSNLRVTAAKLAGGEAVEVLQPRDPGREPDPAYQGQWVYLRLPKPAAPGDAVQLELSYHGKQVVQRVGSGNFFARSAGWYPLNLWGPPFERASFTLHFKVDHRYTVVATGERTSNQRQGDFQLTNWTTPAPLTVAGFALGDYTELSSPATLGDGQKVAVNVFSNNNPDDMLQSFNLIGSLPQAAPPPTIPMGTLDTKRLAPEALAQVSGALRFMEDYYGPYPYSSLSVVPIPGNYGQGWPGLLYLSSLSFLDATQLHLLGVPSTGLNQLSDTFRAHETSHQWWGHRVSWASYHDQWISEGFANASSLLFQQASDGTEAALETLKEWRRDLEAKSQFGVVHDQDGPLWLGSRLVSSKDPSGYEIITYDKGGYVLYMLRQMMWDASKKDPDENFKAMMRDFTSTYANQDASTAEFQKIVEKHMQPVMDIDHNHSMDWFFQKFVYGTGIPHLKFRSSVVPDGSHFKATLEIDNPDGWHGLLPVYLVQGKHFIHGQVPVIQAHETVPIELGFKPDKIVANQFLDMLVEVDQ
ncbi:MAG TPA: M1 family aminopeptidase [Terriglobales bacterium]|nr:M1 family aminopeptidase [Terriglobales bacterium]